MPLVGDRNIALVGAETTLSHGNDDDLHAGRVRKPRPDPSFIGSRTRIKADYSGSCRHERQDFGSGWGQHEPTFHVKRAPLAGVRTRPAPHDASSEVPEKVGFPLRSRLQVKEPREERHQRNSRTTTARHHLPTPRNGGTTQWRMRDKASPPRRTAAAVRPENGCGTPYHHHFCGPCRNATFRGHRMRPRKLVFRST